MEAKGDIDREPKKHSGRGSLGRVGSHYVLHWSTNGKVQLLSVRQCYAPLINTPQHRTTIVSWLQKY